VTGAVAELIGEQATESEPASGERSPAGRGALFGWVLFDWAQQPVFTLVTTFLFAPYFANVFVGDPVQGQAIWGYATAIAGLIVALTSPVMGAMADATGRRKPWILVFSVLLVIGSAMLWSAAPGAQNLLWFVVGGFILATVAVESQTVFLNSMMPALVPSSQLGRLSGIGWAVGYVGGLVSLVIMAGFIVTDPASGKTLLGLDPVIHLDAESRQADRLVGPFSAVWFILFAIPFFLFTPDQGVRARAGIRAGIDNLVQTISHVWSYKNILTFLLARMLYIDGLLAIFAFGGIYGASIFNWQPLELGLFGIVLTIAGTIGAVAGGFLDDLIGPKPVITVALILLVAATFGIVSVDANHIMFTNEVAGAAPGDGLFASTPERFYLLLACVVGIVAGPIQTASRSLMARLAPPEKITQFFGLFAFSGKITSFIAPLVVGLVTQATNSQRLGISVTIAFLIAGLIVFQRVETPPPARYR